MTKPVEIERPRSRNSHHESFMVERERRVGKDDNVYEFFPHKELIKRQSLRTQHFFSQKNENVNYRKVTSDPMEIKNKFYSNYRNVEPVIESYALNDRGDVFKITDVSRTRKYDRNSERTILPKRMYNFIDRAKNKMRYLIK